MSERFSEKLDQQIKEHGISPADVQSQLDRFRKGFSNLEIDRPATIGDGILDLSEDQKPHLTERFHQAQKEGRVMKFVPASGAASRMFKVLQSMLNEPEKLTPQYFEANKDHEDVRFAKTFLDNLEVFAFYEDLVEVLKKAGKDPAELKKSGDYHTLLSFVLENRGLALASLPKALIPFHRYDDHRRAPLEEHLAEAIAYTRPENGSIRIHFTISPEHEKLFYQRLESVRSKFESDDTRLHVETSFQKPETDTIAADPENQPFLDDEGNAVFRPGGHGALLVNLEELQGDIVFIKNIDNVVPDRLKETTHTYKKLIGGYLLTIQDKIFYYLKELDRGEVPEHILDEIISFLRSELFIDLPDEIAHAKKQRSDDKLVMRWLYNRLNRPIRVCGMVKNEGEPGGGPFIVNHDDGTTSLQIVESAQVNMEDAQQRKLFESSTHFNPVDLVCSLRDYRGHPFDLQYYRDPETGFISMKSYQGRDLKALELPGLWNGSMAFWNTVFVEVPGSTFCPVKTVNDLLREEHRNESELY